MTSLLKYPYSIIRPIYEQTHFHKSVITEVGDEDLMSAYSHCRAITRHHAKTFYMATRFLPNHKQRSIFAIYSLCRYLDDLVDEGRDPKIQKKIRAVAIVEKLEIFKIKLINTYKGIEHKDPVLMAFADTLKRFDISIDYPLLLMEGVKTDLVKSRYNSFNELYDYSYKVASVVGLMTSEIFGYNDPKAIGHAIDLGIAMQLTNILRDVGEDLRNDRIYLPEEELNRFGVSERDLFDHKMSENFIELMKFQVKRATDYYESSDPGIVMLSKDSRFSVSLARENYSRILKKIEENRYDVFSQRAYLNSTEKLSIVPKVLIKLRNLGQ